MVFILVVCLFVNVFMNVVIVVMSCFLVKFDVLLYSCINSVMNFLDVELSSKFLINGLKVGDFRRNCVKLFFGDLSDVFLMVNILFRVVNLLFMVVFVMVVKLLFVIVFSEMFMIDMWEVLNFIFWVVVVLIIVLMFKCKLSKLDMFWWRLLWVVGRFVRFI